MPRDRKQMTGRVVPLRSREASESRVGGTVAERIALIAELSEMTWLRTGRPVPSYSRATMPVVITTLGAQGAHEDSA